MEQYEVNGSGDITDGIAKTSLAPTYYVNFTFDIPNAAANAEKDEANWLQPTEDEVTYSDGTTETVNGFDVPVEKLNTEFDLAILGEKGTWYDHKVSVSNPN